MVRFFYEYIEHSARKMLSQIRKHIFYALKDMAGITAF